MSADTPHARVKVLTFKEGLLSPIAHDLELEMGKFSIAMERGAVSATFWPGSLSVVGVRRGPRLLRDVLSTSDRNKIVRNIQREVLRTDRNPEASFVGRVEDGGKRLAGELTLAGESRRLELFPKRIGGRVEAKVEIQPSRHGVRPYRAMAGTLRVQDRVQIEVELELAEDVDPLAVTTTWSSGT